MNRWRHILARVSAAILLMVAGKSALAADFWADGFEGNASQRWGSTGVWQMNNPVVGPPVNGQGYRTFQGTACASTEYYPPNQNVRLYCTNYLNRSNSIIVPPASLSPTLNFWQWCNINAGAAAYVEINTSNGWQPISQTYQNLTTGGAWVQTSLDLSGYAGQSVQFGFHFISGPTAGNSLGWFVDTVALAINAPPTLTVPTNQTVFAGQTMMVAAAATNSYLPNAQYSYRLLGYLSGVSITNGLVTWPVPANRQPGANTIGIQVTDNSIPPQTATNSFVVTVVNPWIPELTSEPLTQTIYAGQAATVANTAANPYFPGDTFTFDLVTNRFTAYTNMLNLQEPDDELRLNGNFNWQTLTSQRAGTNVVYIKVTDTSAPNYSATNQFQIIVLTNPPPPTLTLPPTQFLYSGQQLSNIISASSVFQDNPGDEFTFGIGSHSPTNVSIRPIDATTAAVLWTAPTLPTVLTTNISITTTDSISGLVGFGSFQVVVTPKPLPSLTVPPVVTNFSGQIVTVPLTATNNTGFAPQNEFSFSLVSPINDAQITSGTNLVWTTTGITNGVLMWSNNPTPAALGNKTITIAVTDTNTHLVGTTHFAIFFKPPPAPALIAPTNWYVYFGQRFTNFLSATNLITLTNAFAYAYFNVTSAASATNIVIQTTPTNGLVIWTNITAAPGTNYLITAKVTDNSIPPLVGTNDFLVHVVPPPSQLFVTNVALVSGTNFHFTIQTIWTNYTWLIVATTNLNGGATNWLPIFTNKTGPGGVMQFTDLVSTNYLRRFYRATFQ